MNKILLLVLIAAVVGAVAWKYRQQLGLQPVPPAGPAAAAFLNGHLPQRGSLNDSPHQDVQDLQLVAYDDDGEVDSSASSVSENPKLLPIANHSYEDPPTADLDGSEGAEDLHPFSVQSHGMVGHL